MNMRIDRLVYMEIYRGRNYIIMCLNRLEQQFKLGVVRIAEREMTSIDLEIWEMAGSWNVIIITCLHFLPWGSKPTGQEARADALANFFTSIFTAEPTITRWIQGRII